MTVQLGSKRSTLTLREFLLCRIPALHILAVVVFITIMAFAVAVAVVVVVVVAVVVVEAVADVVSVVEASVNAKVLDQSLMISSPM